MLEKNAYTKAISANIEYWRDIVTTGNNAGLYFSEENENIHRAIYFGLATNSKECNTFTIESLLEIFPRIEGWEVGLYGKKLLNLPSVFARKVKDI